MLCLVNAASSTWVHFMECGFTYKSVKGHGMIGQLLQGYSVCMHGYSATGHAPGSVSFAPAPSKMSGTERVLHPCHTNLDMSWTNGVFS